MPSNSGHRLFSVPRVPRVRSGKTDTTPHWSVSLTVYEGDDDHRTTHSVREYVAADTESEAIAEAKRRAKANSGGRAVGYDVGAVRRAD